MSTISPSLQIGGVNGWKGKEGAVLGWQQTSGGLFKPAKFDFTRLSGSASYVDENGLIQIEHRPNYPRFTYQDGKQCLMNEEARTNLITFSDEFDNAAWNKQNGTVTANTQAAPDGTTTADTLTSDGGSVGADKSCVKLQNIIPVSGTYSRSIFMKKGNTRYGWISTLGTSFEDANVFIFDFDNDEITFVDDTSEAIIDTKVVKYENGWYRFVFISNSDTTGITANFTAGMTKSPTSVLNHDLGDFVYIWGAQLEQGAYASSYIPTEGSAVTRAAESVEGLNLGNFLGDSQGGLYVDGLVFDTTTKKEIGITSGAITNSFRLGFIESGEFRMILVKSGSAVSLETGGAYSANQFYKCFQAYAPQDLSLVVDGTEILTNTTADTYSDGTLNRIVFEAGDGSSNPFRGLIHELRAYDQRPANSQLESDTQ